ncbi:hypothetical protein [Nonomuraea insulae]|uniref:Uncharacterized protein n=1 Tax=Nonomuraea insulae TaxID=1616787 RepID=A0ABW1CAC1_9ACTN
MPGAEAYDVIGHLPHVTAGEPDDDALFHSPKDVQEVFGEWRERSGL